MAPGRQTSLTQVEWEGRARRTRRAEFLDQTGPVVPWADLLALVEPLRPTAGRRGRQPWPAETLPGTRPARCWPDLSDVACEDACYDSLSVRDFVGCRYRVPDATTPGDFRHLPGENGVGRALPGVVVARLEAAGLAVRGGSVVDATTMEAPSSTKNASGSRDPGTRLAERGSRWRLGTRCHPGKDAGGGPCHADAGWRGVAKRAEVASDPRLPGAGWRVAMGPSGPGAARRARRDGRGEGRRRGLRAREGKRPCQIARRTFGYARVRYRGIAKNASARPRPARQRQPAYVRQGREAGGAPGGLRGGRLTAAEGTVCREGARRGLGRPRGPQGSEHDQKPTD